MIPRLLKLADVLTLFFIRATKQFYRLDLGFEETLLVSVTSTWSVISSVIDGPPILSIGVWILIVSGVQILVGFPVGRPITGTAYSTSLVGWKRILPSWRFLLFCRCCIHLVTLWQVPCYCLLWLFPLCHPWQIIRLQWAALLCHPWIIPFWYVNPCFGCVFVVQ